ncbi:MAG: hypothetical protein ABI478_07475, partial [Propionivibrio sp.]
RGHEFDPALQDRLNLKTLVQTTTSTTCTKKAQRKTDVQGSSGLSQRVNAHINANLCFYAAFVGFVVIVVVKFFFLRLQAFIRP